ncbi:hypothetical protein CASFOL_006265 [Castilleja foliolosa]|uniref:Uncharacterized protein n=1 Tax=Castilleja foliolosa TaxID=1961234 RepID=A0ABD3E6T7_9LAMI
MFSALRCRALSSSPLPVTHQWRNLPPSSTLTRYFSSPPLSSSEISNSTEQTKELLSLAEVEKILNDVGADDVQVIQTPSHCEFTDHMVVATGRSPWHVRNISQALIYKIKQKQKGAKRVLLPTVVGQEGGKWIVIDSGKLIIHAVDENARAYYNFEGLWSSNTSNMENTENTQDLENAFVKVRRKNNSKKPSKAHA